MSRGAITALAVGWISTVPASLILEALGARGLWVVAMAVALGLGVSLATAWVFDELRRRSVSE